MFNLKNGAAILVVIALAYAVGLSLEADHGHGPGESHAGETAQEDIERVDAPDFTLPRLGGGQVTLSGLRGKWVFINFWATWCGPCVVEMPMLNKMYHQLKGENFEMIAVNMENIAPEKAREFVDNLGIDFTVVLDRESAVGNAYGVSALPATFFVSPTGAVEAHGMGAREWDRPEMIKYFRSIMDGKAAEEAAAEMTGAETK